MDYIFYADVLVCFKRSFFGSFVVYYCCLVIVYISLFTHADRQGVDISFTVFIVCLFFVCLYGYGFLRRG